MNFYKNLSLSTYNIQCKVVVLVFVYQILGVTHINSFNPYDDKLGIILMLILQTRKLSPRHIKQIG